MEPSGRSRHNAGFRWAKGAVAAVPACLLLLAACSDAPHMLAQRRDALQVMTKTVVYVVPQAPDRMEHEVALLDYPFGKSESATIGFFLGGLLYTTADILGHHEAFDSEMQRHANELAKLPFASDMERTARSSIAAVPWMRGAHFVEVPYHRDRYFFSNVTRREKTRAVIFIFPKAVIKDDATAVGVSYGIDVYVADPTAGLGARELTSATVGAMHTIAYPPAVQHFNVLTAPTATPEAWRMRLLFARHATLFRTSMDRAMREAEQRLIDYFRARG